MRTPLIALAATAALALAACTSDDQGASTASAAPGTEASAASTDVNDPLAVITGEPFPAERCTANEDAGTITFLTGFDYAAASAVIDVIAADAAGYFEQLCLDVEIVPGDSESNYPQIASGTAQFASGGSFSQVVEFGRANEADLVAATVEGRSAIDTLIIKSGVATELADLNGATIGVIDDLPPSIDVMLRGAGLEEGEHFDTALLESEDPIANIAIEPIAGLPGRKSAEVGALERDGIGVLLFDPLDFGVPGSFGVIFTSQAFITEHPTAAEDFVRATARGLADAIADPTTAAEAAVALITSNGNPNSLSPEAEVFRWETEAQLVLEGTPEGIGLGVPDQTALQNEVDAYAAVGLFGDLAAPTALDYIANGLASGVYDDAAEVVWPG